MPVILDHDRRAICPTTATQVGTQRESRQGIRLDGHQVCIGECLGSGHDKAAGARPRIYDTGRLALSRNPTQHRTDDGSRCVDRANRTPCGC